MSVPTTRDPAADLQHALLSRLKLRQLSLLQAIDRHRTLGRVAAEMRVSQPAITKALREAEDIFGSRLFERTSRGLVPTPAGDAVLHYAQRWLAELEATSRVLTSLEAGRSGRLRLGLTQQVPQLLLSAALTHLLDRTPRVAVMTREGTTDELVASLVARELDCAIGRSYDGDATGLVQEAIHQQEPCLVVAAKSVKRLSRGPLDWARLAQLDWILGSMVSCICLGARAVGLAADVERRHRLAGAVGDRRRHRHQPFFQFLVHQRTSPACAPAHLGRSAFTSVSVYLVRAVGVEACRHFMQFGVGQGRQQHAAHRRAIGRQARAHAQADAHDLVRGHAQHVDDVRASSTAAEHDSFTSPTSASITGSARFQIGMDDR
jgi:DNA-binding transcriptional LysR family regulator